MLSQKSKTYLHESYLQGIDGAKCFFGYTNCFGSPLPGATCFWSCQERQTANPGDWPPGGFWRLAARSILFSFTLWGSASLGRNHFPSSFSRMPLNLQLYNVDSLPEYQPSFVLSLHFLRSLICESSRFHKDVLCSRSSRSS